MKHGRGIREQVVVRQVALHVVIHTMTLRFRSDVGSNLPVTQYGPRMLLPVAEAEEIHSLHQTKLLLGIPRIGVQDNFP